MRRRRRVGMKGRWEGGRGRNEGGEEGRGEGE